MKLYSFVPQDCSGKVRWLLHEMGLSFEDIRLSYKNGDSKTAEYLQKHPLGQVPVLEDENGILFESQAILLYLADKYPEKKMAPPVNDMKARAQYYQWMQFAVQSAERYFDSLHRLPKTTEEYKKDWEGHIREKLLLVMKRISEQLNGQDYILGSFSAVDTCLGYALDSVSEESFFQDFPVVKGYYQRLSERPACLKSEIFKRP